MRVVCRATCVPPRRHRQCGLGESPVVAVLSVPPPPCRRWWAAYVSLVIIAGVGWRVLVVVVVTVPSVLHVIVAVLQLVNQEHSQTDPVTHLSPSAQVPSAH